jgi:hypothetical protein
MKKFLCLLLIAINYNCFGQTATLDDLFCPVDTNWAGKTLVVPQGILKYNILCKEGDIAHNLEKGNSAALKGGFGSLFYSHDGNKDILIDNIRMDKSQGGWLYMSLQDNKKSSIGDGGGLVRMRVEQDNNNEWKVVPQTDGGTTYNFSFIDLDGFGGSVGNNGLHLGFTNKSALNDRGNIFMYDEWAASDNDIMGGLTDMSNYTLPVGTPQPGKVIPRYQNMGWIIEIDANTGMPIKKVYEAGRANIGGICATSSKASSTNVETNNQEIIFTTHSLPSVILKYEKHGALDPKIYAFKQKDNSYDGNWILLNDEDIDGTVFPFSFDELLDVQTLALKKGATMFNRLSGITKSDEGSGIYYIAESGNDFTGDEFTNPAKAFAGKLAYHLQKIDGNGDNNFSDAYGRILKLTPGSNGIECKSYMEGGVSSDKRYTFSNPKNLFFVDFTHSDENVPGSQSYNRYLIISEEIPASGFRRNPDNIVAQEDLMNEVYFLKLGKSNPDMSDIRPFAIGPKGAELQTAFTIEARMSPMFLSIRYPNNANDAPYNHSLLMSINNFEEFFVKSSSGCSWVKPGPGTLDVPSVSATSKDEMVIWPNPTSRMLYFDKMQKGIAVYDISGRMVKSQKNITELSVFDLTPGVYFIKNTEGQVKKVIIE